MIDSKTHIKNFYNRYCFPGEYTKENIELLATNEINPFVEVYKKACAGKNRVLDIGCGTGYLTNVLATCYPNTIFDAVDFANQSLQVGKNFALANKIENVNWVQCDFAEFEPENHYDAIISNGVLHHMPDMNQNIDKIKKILSPNGELAIGIYNFYGKVYKKFFTVKYVNSLLEKDQEMCPFEMSFTDKEFLNFFREFKTKSVFPGRKNQFVDFLNLFNFKNGGLTVYHLESL